jgi:tetratricopeptide (TPR) repeat protein
MLSTHSTTRNIYYHLGLAYYLQGDFESARAAYERCLAASTNNDMYVATADWLYMTLRRLGAEEAAAALLETISADMEIIENTSYHNRLLMYKGERSPESLLEVEAGEDRALTFATQGYGVGNWYLYNGDADRAEEIFLQVLEGDYWAAFGYIAAEAEIARLRDAG